MLILLLACTPNLTPTDTDTQGETGEALPSCATEAGDLTTDQAASIIISNTELETLDLGRGVSVCDLNGDGHGDLLVSGSHGPQRRGAIGVFYGPATDWPSEMDLSEADSLIQGSVDYTYLGISLDCGDLDGDGFADIVATNAELLDTEIPADTDSGVHIWYGSQDPLSATLSELQADVSLHYDYGKPSANRLYGMKVLVLDLDGDGQAEVSLATNESGAQAGVRDRVFVLEGGRHTSGELTESTSTIWGIEGSDISPSQIGLGGAGTGLLLSYRGAADPLATILDSPLSAGMESYAEDEAWLNLEIGKSTDSLHSPASIQGESGPILVAPAADAQFTQAFVLVLKDLEEGYKLATDSHRTAISELQQVHITHVYAVGDYNGDGVEDLGVNLYHDPTSDDRFWALGVLDGSRLGTPDVALESLLLNRVLLTESNVNNGADQGFSDLDGDGCSDLFWGEPYFGPAAPYTHDQGRVVVMLSTQR